MSNVFSQDVVGIELTGLSLSSKIINLDGSDERVWATINFQEDLSGFDRGYLGYYSNDLDKYISLPFIYDHEIDKTSAQGYMNINQYAASGTYELDSIALHDKAGNSFYANHDDDGWEDYLASAGVVDTSFEVKNTNQDVEGIELTGLSLSSKIINLDGSDERVWATINFQEDLSGFDRGYLGYYSNDLDKYISLPFIYDHEIDKTSAQGYMNINQYAASGTYELDSIALHDKAGNSFYANHDDDGWEDYLASAGVVDTSFEVKNTNQDVEGIELTGLSLSSKIINLDGSDERVWATINFQEDLSGFDRGYLGYYSNDLDKYISLPFIYDHEIDKASAQGYMNINQYAASGTYELDSIALHDKAGNSFYANHDDDGWEDYLASAGVVDTSFTISRKVSGNHSPILSGTPVVLANGTEDVDYILKASDLLQGYSDPDGDSLSVTDLTSSVGSLTNNGNGTWTLNTPKDFNGKIRLSYSVVDGKGGSLTAQNSYSLPDLNKSPSFPAFIELRDLDGSNGFKINGIDEFDRPFRVSGAGDINGDGIDDLIIGATGAYANGNANSGETYVIFGSNKVFSSSFNLSDLNGKNGFKINGIGRNDFSGSCVSSAGDVNDDGNDDLIISSTMRNKVWVVFGSNKSFSSSIELSDLNGRNGFTIYGSGGIISDAGDVNGDGIDDLILGDAGADANYRRNVGEAYVIFGSKLGFNSKFNLHSGALSNLNGANGFEIIGIDQDDYAGGSVSGAGDVNGDGIDDLIIGASGADANGKQDSGETYVVFGNKKGFSSSTKLSELNGNNGFKINGIGQHDRSGNSVSGAGDVNGDGIDDLIIGAVYADANGNVRAGESYVVFGNNKAFNSTVELSDLNGITGFQINGIDAEDRLGSSVSGAGDVNGDGVDDLIIGASGGDPNGDKIGQVGGAGETYVVFGSTKGFNSILELSDLNGSKGFKINGIDTGDSSGGSVSGAGDVNGDGIDDLIIGGTGANESYVVFGRSSSNDDEQGNNKPILRGTPSFLANGAEDLAYVVKETDLLEGYSDPDGHSLSVAGLTSSIGSLIENGNDTWTLNTPKDFNGKIELSYAVIDGNGGSVAAQNSFLLTAVNDVPILSGHYVVLADGTEDVAYTIKATDLLQGYSDVDGDVLSISDLTTSVGSLADNGDSTWMLTTPDSFNGSIDLSYFVIDGNGGSIAATKKVSLTAVNDAPILTRPRVDLRPPVDLVDGTGNVAYTIKATDLLQGYRDFDGDVLSIIDLTTSLGSLADNGDSTWTLTTPDNFNGRMLLYYSVIDGNGGSIAATRDVLLTAVNYNYAPVEDKIIGTSYRDVETAGTTDLVTDSLGGVYARSFGGTLDAITYNGSQMKDGFFAGWSIKGAETIDGVNNVTWKHSSGSISIWNTDANWNYTGGAFYGSANTSEGLQWEAAFDQDFNEDKIIGTSYRDVETAGTTDLVTDSLGGVYARSFGGTLDAITYNGSQMKDGFFAGWSIKGAETIDGVNNVTWKHSSGSISIWNTDANWNYTGGAFYGSANTSEGLQWEAAFDQDFNEDKIIGTSYRDVETAGTTDLVTDSLGGVYARSFGGTLDAITYNGSQMKDGFFAGWSIKGAETIDGVNNVTWKHSSGSISIWNTDANWNYTGGAFYGSANTSEGLQWEAAFDQDFNEDKIIGTSYRDVETAGTTDLVTDSLGGVYARSSGGTLDAITYNGSQMKDGFFAGWSIKGAETIDGVNNVTWKHSSGSISIWNTDANWNYTGGAFYGSANTSEGLQWEAAFDQDFNEDKIIGTSYRDVETAGTTDLVTDSLGGVYARSSGGTLDAITYNGSQMKDGFFAGWSIKGAETIDGVNNVTWKHSSGSISIWNTDANWNYTGGAFYGSANTSEGLQWEAAFDQDFNEDKIIGTSYRDVETAGTTDLVTDSLGGVYARSSGGTLDAITYNGSQMKDGFFAGWSIKGAETIDGVNNVTWKHSSGSISIWNTDANWNYTGGAFYGSANTSEGLQWEAAFDQDFNEDKMIGADPLA